MTQINAYLTFNGQCREAMSFYQQCLGGELSFQSIGDTPLGQQCSEGMKHHIMHSELRTKSWLIMATDMVGPGEFVKGTNFSLSLNCSSEKEIDTYFEKLSEGGKVIDPLGMKPWGAKFGVVADKFGVAWMLNWAVGV